MIARMVSWTVVASFVLCSFSAVAAPTFATVSNQTRPTQCAEEDNVSLTLHGVSIHRFRVEALQPPYLSTVGNDLTAPDFSGCNFDGGVHPTDPAHRFTPRTKVLLDSARWKVVGMTLPTFWRPQNVPVRVDGKRDGGFHLLQFFRKTRGKTVEVMVLYPADGYWRVKPLPELRFGDGAYGSSFLIGPIEQDGRPVVNIASIDVDTGLGRRPLEIRLRFANGNRAIVQASEINRVRTALDVTMEPPTSGNAAFAVLRSMYVAPDNADMSEVSWQAAPTRTTQTTALADIVDFRTTRVRFGRRLQSRHNTSAPDVEFSAFENSSVPLILLPAASP
jgi:hypothetical protein